MESDLVVGPGTSYLVSLRVRSEDAGACIETLSRLNERMRAAPGFDSVEVIRRDGGLGVDFYILARFASEADLDKWLALPDRTCQLSEIEALAIADISRQRVSGSNIWFEPVKGLPSAPEPPLLWKRWALSLLAVYPALMALIYLLRPIVKPLPEALGLLLVATILTGLTSAFIVPWLTRKLHSWLVRR